jgi:putative alpha-1,2-mannosidase
LRGRQTLDLYYSNTRSGLPGNSDSGALDSWMIWTMVGFYPVATQPIYLILAPMFSNLELKVGLEKKTLKITAEGLSEENMYVQSLKVNGKPWNQSWLTHDDIANGGTLEFVLGSDPAPWDTGDLPPSPGHFTLDVSQ